MKIMTFMKRLKQRIAAALVVVMTVTMMAGPSWAEEAPVRTWRLTDGFWYYYDGNGEMIQGREKYIHEKWYGFDDEGRMYSDEMFESRKANSGPYLYAFPDGNLAKGWVKLTADHHLVTSPETDVDSSWYYFKGGSSSDDPVKMVYGEEKTVQGKRYRLDDEGKMYSADWFIGEDSEGNDIAYYYQIDGEKAAGKWLPLDDFWYHFNSSGKVVETASAASPSDATPMVEATMSNATPARLVENIAATPSNAAVEAVLGEPVTLDYLVTLASDSNATEQGYTDFTKYHDFAPGTYVSGSFKVKQTSSNGICTVEFTPKKLGTQEVVLRIDDEYSDPIKVITKVKDTDDKSAVVDSLIDSLVNSGAEGGVLSADTRNDILSVLQESNEAEKKSIQKSIAENTNYHVLENTYITENKIDVKPVNVADDAKALLGNGAISMVGGALNAEAEEPVELTVAAIDAPALTEEFTNKIAFDIKLLINGDDSKASELDFPVKISMPVPAGFDPASMKLFHIHNDEEAEVEFTVNGNLIEFTTSGFSAFVFVQNTPVKPSDSGGGSGSGSGSGSSNRIPANGVVTTDIKKGKVNSLTGIIIGSGDGYSKWIQETSDNQETGIRWKLQYADGTYAAGSYLLDEQGSPRRDSTGSLIEQPAWELIGGAWYAFGADGYAKSGMMFDPAYNGWFYLDINTGMKTGWQQIDGKWYYFNSSSDGSKGIMYVSRTTPDGYTVDADGVWNGQ
ncbi:N-acetylmuramoyl-L-alanine amidase family protein [Hungatella hathewayi]|uniref:N-acetylmuramoyl-L-alanine amidase family protein n=1 Tax=Hungatella hathewayi TaxID=154046 RepID=UPI003565D4B3